MSRKPSPKQMDEMFDEWLANQEKIKPSIKTEALKAKIKKELKQFQSDEGIKEYALHHKWLEVKEVKKKYRRKNWKKFITVSGFPKVFPITEDYNQN